MDTVFRAFGEAYGSRNGYKLASALSPDLSVPRLEAIYNCTKHHSAKAYIRRSLQSLAGPHMTKDELDAWTEIMLHYWVTIGTLLTAQHSGHASTELHWTKVYTDWKETVSLLIRGYQNHGFEAWTIPCLYVAGKYLRVFAIKADEEKNSKPVVDQAEATFQDDMDLEMEQNQQLEDCARQLNRVFNLCLNDRASLADSRKWGIYYTINLLFKTYFKLNQGSLSRNVLRALVVYRGDMPPLTAFPKSQQVTFKYYEGVLSFLDEQYLDAEKHLTEALSLCHKGARRNKELILTYLIPCHLLTSHTLPSQKLIAPHPHLQQLFLPVSSSIKKGDLKSFDAALRTSEDDFIKRRIYLTLERGRDITLRNLMRKVYQAAGYEEFKDPAAEPVKRYKLPIALFTAAISHSSQQKVDSDEVECQIANMIYKGLMKGYIARGPQYVILSRTQAFPGTHI